MIDKKLEAVSRQDIVEAHCDECGKLIENPKSAVIWEFFEGKTAVKHPRCYFKKK